VSTAAQVPDLKTLAVELQSLGVRTRVPDGPGATRAGGAGPSDAGFVWIDGAPLTVPVHGDYVAASPYALVMNGSGRAGTLLRDGAEVGQVRLHPRPKIYDLETADGVPYWKIALMHLDSLASTVHQRCVYWGTQEQCHFCAIGTSLSNGRTIPTKTPALLAEVAEAAARLDGAKDVTRTTGSPNRHDRGAPYMARCAEAIRESSGLPVQVQIEPPDDFTWFRTLKDSGAEALGLHLEVWDEEVLARVAPGKHAQGRDHYLAAWEAAVGVFGPGQVSTYFILGLGETPESVMEGCRAAIDRGVYPFVVPLRPAPGSIVADGVPPSAEYVREVYERVAPLLAEAGMMSQDARAGCVRCQACSALSTFERAFGGGRDGVPAGPGPAQDRAA
jgi:radical SAM protein (TIGR04043 family)